MADETQKPLKGWQSGALQAVSKYYAVLAEKASFDERLDAAKREAEHAGATFHHGSPNVDAHEPAHRCPCGAVVVLDYYRRADRDSKATLHCRPCVEKTAQAVAEDAAEEGTKLPAQKPGTGGEIPF